MRLENGKTMDMNMQINEILQDAAHIWVVLSDDLESGIFLKREKFQGWKKVTPKGISHRKDLTKKVQTYITINLKCPITPFYSLQPWNYSYLVIK